VSGSSAILVGGSPCVAMATPSADAAIHMALHVASQYQRTASARSCAVPAVDQGARIGAADVPSCCWPGAGLSGHHP
jgi:hypothetical protein